MHDVSIFRALAQDSTCGMRFVLFIGAVDIGAYRDPHRLDPMPYPECRLLRCSPRSCGQVRSRREAVLVSMI
jgi:hypothetical protein